MDYQHTPVLLQEVIQLLDPQPNQNFVDGTLGGGGYALALTEKIGPEGKVLAIDLDRDALKAFKTRNHKPSLNDRVILVQGNFGHLAKITKRHGFRSINGIVADIGLSSYQLEQSGRGISFQKDEPLDMRFDITDRSLDAKVIINDYDERNLAKLLRDYGEERHAAAIARRIVQARQHKPLLTTFDLTAVIQSSLPKPDQHRWQDSARRVFQALRIAVNHELDNLKNFLPQALDMLVPGGRLCVVTFHSLEDRIVKQFFVAASRGCVCPPEFPICRCGRNPEARLLTKKPITAGLSELQTNPRSQSAKLRAIEKI